MKEADLTDKEYEDFNGIIHKTLNELVKCADKHNIDRDSFIRYFVSIFGAMVHLTTFSYYTPTEKGGEE